MPFALKSGEQAAPQPTLRPSYDARCSVLRSTCSRVSSHEGRGGERASDPEPGAGAAAGAAPLHPPRNPSAGSAGGTEAAVGESTRAPELSGPLLLVGLHDRPLQCERAETHSLLGGAGSKAPDSQTSALAAACASAGAQGAPEQESSGSPGFSTPLRLSRSFALQRHHVAIFQAPTDGILRILKHRRPGPARTRSPWLAPGLPSRREFSEVLQGLDAAAPIGSSIRVGCFQCTA